MFLKPLVIAAFSLILFMPAAQAGPICTLIADPVKNVNLLDVGECDDRTSPASTFKFALALMAIEEGIITDVNAPKWPFKDGYAAWGGKNWQRQTNPTDWLTYSVVWYSQVITKQMGMEKLKAYAQDFTYGNQDFSGDPGKNNGLAQAWLGSSLQISPREQMQLLARYINKELNLSAQTYALSRDIMPSQQINGWRVFGKTGMAFPRTKDGQYDRQRPYGWYIGWAEKGDDRRIFVRLRQDDLKMKGSTGKRAQAGVLAALTPFLTD